MGKIIKIQPGKTNLEKIKNIETIENINICYLLRQHYIIFSHLCKFKTPTL